MEPLNIDPTVTVEIITDFVCSCRVKITIIINWMTLKAHVLYLNINVKIFLFLNV